MNLNKLRDEIHDNAVKHGFWEGERSIAECLVLIHSEVSEALEADRNGKYAKGNIKPETIEWMAKTWEKITFLENFILKVKDTFEDELADVVIRCLDLCGHLEIDVDKEMEHELSRNIFKNAKTIAEQLLELHCWITYAVTDDSYGEEYSSSSIVGIIDVTMELAKLHNIDIEKHIELKMKYNETREYKHGKKY